MQGVRERVAQCEENDKEGKRRKGMGTIRRKEAENGSGRGERISKMPKMGAKGGSRVSLFQGLSWKSPCPFR